MEYLFFFIYIVCAILSLMFMKEVKISKSEHISERQNQIIDTYLKTVVAVLWLPVFLIIGLGILICGFIIHFKIGE